MQLSQSSTGHTDVWQTPSNLGLHSRPSSDSAGFWIFVVIRGWLPLLGLGWARRGGLRFRAVVFLLILAAFAPPVVGFDLVIRGGRVVDGTGAPAAHLDIAIQGGRIARMGAIAINSGPELNAGGLVVAPGFIDVHTHAENILENPDAENFIRMGVTSVVLGNCGSSVADVSELFKKVETMGAAVNVGTLIGHGTVRLASMKGSFMRPPTPTEMSRMIDHVSQAMDDGALGLSTGLIYVPGVFSTTQEIISLAKAAAARGGIYATHMRDEGAEIDQALQEVFQIAREAKIPAQISHLKLSGRAAWGRAEELLSQLEQARASGLDITQDVYVYTAASTGLSQLIPEEFRGFKGEAFWANLELPGKRSALAEAMEEKLKRRKEADYHYVVISHWPRDPSLDGKTLPEAARSKFGGGSLRQQIDLILEIHGSGGASAVFHGIKEEDLREFALHPNTMFASDSSVRKFGEGVPHPRGYGDNARVLGRYVRELRLLRLEEAVRRMTSLPAAVFGLPQRGVLREGARADLAVFDPAVISDEATFEKPHHYSKGMTHVIVNGALVIEAGIRTGKRPGAPLRNRMKGL